MNYKKIQTRVRAVGQPASASGEPSVMELGWVYGTHLDEDIERERERFSRIALAADRHPDGGIKAVEVVNQTVVAIYENGSVCVINYYPEGTR